MNKIKIGIDIGVKNFSLCINENDIVSQYILLNLIDGKDIIKKIKKVYDEFILKYIGENVEINIEKQVTNATINCYIQYILETILYLNNVKYRLINPELKYRNLKLIYNIDRIIKSQLKKYIEIDITKSVKYTLENNVFIASNSQIKKYDDLIDAYILSCL